MTKPEQKYDVVFSIIIASLNAANTIRDTIDSVLNQDFPDFEIIVKDGGSTDATLAMIPKDNRILVYFDADKGIYDGMNQGAKKARGKYLLFLNCGDSFASSSVLTELYKCVKEESVVIYGNYNTKGRFVQSPSKTTKLSLFRNPLCHQTMVIPHSVLRKYGYYNTEYKILADYEFTVHSFVDGIQWLNSGITVCNYLGDGISTQKKHRELIDKEYKRIRERYFRKTERILYSGMIYATFPRLRAYMVSDNAPGFIRIAYNNLANLIKKI